MRAHSLITPLAHAYLTVADRLLPKPGCAMLRRLLIMLLIAIPVVLAGDTLFAQGIVDSNLETRPGAYFSWAKLLSIGIVFIMWVRMTDWINRDSMKIGEQTKLTPEAWNPISLGAFAIGFLVVIFVPLFIVGYSLFLICAWTPFAAYFLMRRSAVKARPELARSISSSSGETYTPELPQDAGAEIEFSPAGADAKSRQVNLIRARQSEGFPILKNMLFDAMTRRSDIVMLDYTRDRVNIRMQIDGTWHAIPEMDRQIGDAVLASLKSLAGLNIADRKNRQTGQFDFKSGKTKGHMVLMTQGVSSGERVQVKVKKTSKEILTLGQLGMFPEILETIKSGLNQPGMVIVSAPPGEGLTSTWRGTLETTDRLTRDCVAVLHDQDTESVVENIHVHRYGAQSEKSQFDITKAMLLSQPDFLAVPDVSDEQTMDLLTLQVTSHERSLLTQTSAKSAAEALLKVFDKCGDHDQFTGAISQVTCQKLIRRLCDECKQEVRVPPKIIQQLGGNPKKQGTLFNQYKLPPPEQRVDEKGKPIEFPPCPVCNGIGYIGRIAVFEMIEVDERVRNVLRSSDNPAEIEAAAQKSGKLSLAKQAYQLVLLGITSIAEVQRIFKA